MDDSDDDTTDDWFRASRGMLPSGTDGVGELWGTLGDPLCGPTGESDTSGSGPTRSARPTEHGIAARLVLEADSAGAVAALFPTAATRDPDRQIDVEWLAGDAANAVAVRARRTDEYARLLDVARKQHSRIRPIPETTTAARVTDGDRVREVVTFDVDTLRTDTAHLTVSHHPNRDTRPVAALEYTNRNASDRPEAATVYRTDGRDLDQRQIDVARALATSSETDDGPPSTVSCDCCRVAVGLIRRVGHTAPLTFTCGLLGPSEIGRFDTPTFAAIVSRLDDTETAVAPRSICERSEIAFCP